MTSDQESHVKIRFEIEDPEDPEHIEVETLWAKSLASGGYEIDNIPFCAYGVALGDIIEAERAEDGMLEFIRVLKPSGHSVVRLVHFDAADVQGTREQLRVIGCASELMGKNLVTVDIPASKDYESVREFLDQRSAEGVLDYEEACLGYLPLEPKPSVDS